ncbi:hypothetical protein [Pseudanabaena sp. FACHB-2040]|uniref:hypothetical protein n=1 Tax=Pseudanabaena sp. FACHB-2040 TaxID=2692859 RepID=UPI001683A643|nr:hypothetical protein [Pseudanabaena sp. FACHB-2040]MBD2256378.1 hypothetical protein [Pseudanabaena sp. FACHB-2040]
MENQKPIFGLKDQSPIGVVSELHSFFRDMQSFYKIAQGQILGQIEAADTAEAARLRTELEAINQKIEYFHVLNSAASIADTVMHTPAMIAEFRSEA